MRITWVTRSFLDYRIPVYQAINNLCGGNLTLIYNEEVVPNHLSEKMKHILGNNQCIPMNGEIRLIGKKRQPISTSTSRGIRIPIQKGLITTLKKTKPEIIISDGFFQWTYAPLLIKLFNKNVKHVMCYEGWEHTERNIQGFRIRYRKLAMKCIDAICCNGSLCKQYVENLGFPASKVYIGNMAADNSFFSNACAEINKGQIEFHRKQNNVQGITYLFSGRLVQLKGVKELLFSWIQFSKGKDVFLVLVGDGALKEELIEFCTTNAITNVKITGVIEYADLPVYYKSADCFIIPTLQDNWSLVVPEAMACGLPILCSIYNGCWPELVKEENGWVFDPLNTQSLVEALEKSYQAKDKLMQMGKKSQEIVSHYTPADAAQGIYETCKSVLK